MQLQLLTFGVFIGGVIILLLWAFIVDLILGIKFYSVLVENLIEFVMPWEVFLDQVEEEFADVC